MRPQRRLEPGYVQQQAGRLGFVAGVMPGRLVLPTSTLGLPPILGLSFDTQAALAEDPAQSALREVVLSLDVPQVDRAESPFVRLRESAKAWALAMEGVITDDNCVPLPTDSMDVIGSELEEICPQAQRWRDGFSRSLSEVLFGGQLQRQFNRSGRHRQPGQPRGRPCAVESPIHCEAAS